MTIYTVWSGEYSDRSMDAVFKSKAKAEKYAEVQDELSGYPNEHYVIEYEFSDDKFSLDTKVSRYYMAVIELSDDYKTTEITTDCWWDEFIDYLKPYRELSYEDLSPKNYKNIIENEIYAEMTDVEDQYSVSVERMISNTEVIVQPYLRPIINEKRKVLDRIAVYSQCSYAHARKIAIEKYQMFTQMVLETDNNIQSFLGADFTFDEQNPWKQ